MIDHFRLFAPIYDRVFPAPTKDELQHRYHLPASGWLLDAGGGTGRISRQLTPLIDNIVTADISQPMLKQGAVSPTLVATQASVTYLPFPNDTFSRIIVVDAFHHFQKQQQALRELVRVLAPAGRLIIEEPDISLKIVKLVALAETIALMRSQFHPAPAIEAMLQQHHLKTETHNGDRFSFRVTGTKPNVSST
ncbi:methyltransferase domain-containing protein [candidate division KSB1 bacterium]|nr:methyltransferase domain-containing protein [candidate division KSB1 bacterium]